MIHKFIKGTDNEPLSGVTFKIVDGAGKNVGNSDGVFVTDDSGDIVITGLERGTVVKAREIKTVDGYVLDGTPQDIEIQNSELHELTFWNSPKQSLVIRIFVTDTTTPIPGAAFHVSYSDGKAIGDFVADNIVALLENHAGSQMRCLLETPKLRNFGLKGIQY